MTHVSNDDRVAAAQIRLDQAERLMVEAKRILQYAEKQKELPNGGWPSTECIGAPTQTPPQGSVDWNEEDEECES